jgi:hypothetical protein
MNATPSPSEVDTLARRFVKYLETGISTGLFADDLFFDFTQPLWRMQTGTAAGALAIRQAGHPGSGKVPRWRAAPVPGGFVIEFEERWTDARSDWYCREMAWADVSDGHISRLSVYCTGDWDADRQALHRERVRLIEA